MFVFINDGAQCLYRARSVARTRDKGDRRERPSGKYKKAYLLAYQYRVLARKRKEARDRLDKAFKLQGIGWADDEISIPERPQKWADVGIRMESRLTAVLQGWYTYRDRFIDHSGYHFARSSGLYKNVESHLRKGWWGRVLIAAARELPFVGVVSGLSELIPRFKNELCLSCGGHSAAYFPCQEYTKRLWLRTLEFFELELQIALATGFSNASAFRILADARAVNDVIRKQRLMGVTTVVDAASSFIPGRRLFSAASRLASSARFIVQNKALPINETKRGVIGAAMGIGAGKDYLDEVFDALIGEETIGLLAESLRYPTIDRIESIIYGLAVFADVNAGVLLDLFMKRATNVFWKRPRSSDLYKAMLTPS
jgi:hypothetical protein